MKPLGKCRGFSGTEEIVCAGADEALDDAVLAPAHTDWLLQELIITGPADDIADLRDVVAGAGTIPWVIDYEQMEEDLFLRLVAGPPETRDISLAGARILAGQVRAAAERRHALAVARVGQSQACPFDLHAVSPVPADILRLGPDHPAAFAWLWRHWGTTQALRHVVEVPTPRMQDAGVTLGLRFWSADWTPWAAIAALRLRWGQLRFDVRPTYQV